MATAQATLTQSGISVVAVHVPGGDQGEGDDAHRLLGVVGAVRQGEQGRRADLAPAEAATPGSARRRPGVTRNTSQVPTMATTIAIAGEIRAGQDDLADDAVELGALADPLDAAPAEAGDRSRRSGRRTGRATSWRAGPTAR